MNDKKLSAYCRFLTLVRSWYFLCFFLLFEIFSYFYVDRTLATFIHEHVPSSLFILAEWLTKLGKGAPYFILLPILAGFFWVIAKKRDKARDCLFLLLAITVPSLLCNLIKFTLGRTRPTLFFSEHLYQFTFFQTRADHLSFPSGHSTLIAALMLGLSFIFPKRWLWFMLILIVISSTRIIVGAHFLSDVLGGIYLSIWVVPWLFSRYQKMSQF